MGGKADGGRSFAGNAAAPDDWPRLVRPTLHEVFVRAVRGDAAPAAEEVTA